jgi:hypothetical protein
MPCQENKLAGYAIRTYALIFSSLLGEGLGFPKEHLLA